MDANHQSISEGRVRRALLLSVLIFGCSGCRVTSERFIVGTYRAEAPCVTITLEVNRDHSFVQSVRTHSGEANKLVGRWSVDTSERLLNFEPFLDFLDDSRGRQVGGMSSPVELLPRGITIGPEIVKCPDSTHEIDYIK